MRFLRVVLTPVLLLLAAGACKAINDTPQSGKKITSIRFAASERMPCTPCDLIVTLDDSISFHIKETTGVARINPESTWVVYTTFGGAGGYRGSGQALWRYDIKKAEKMEIMREYFLVEQLELLPVKDGDPLLLVSMREPMTLVRHVGIVDPMRGEVFRAERAAVTRNDSSGITVTEWGAPTSWQTEALNDSTGLPKAAPSRTRHINTAEFRQYAVLENAERVWGQSLEFQATVDTFDVQGQAPMNNAMPVMPQSNDQQPLKQPGMGGGPGSYAQPGARKTGAPAQQGVKVRIP